MAEVSLAMNSDGHDGYKSISIRKTWRLEMITHGAGRVAAAIERGEGGCPLSRGRLEEEEEGAQG